MGEKPGTSVFGLRQPDFLSRMHEQLDELVAERQQMGQLLQVAIEIGSDLELDAILHRIVAAAIGMTVPATAPSASGGRRGP